MSAAAVLPGSYEEPPAYGGGQGWEADQRPTLLVTTVDIGEGPAGRIEVRLGDDPVDVASAFCARHGLPEAIVLPLAQHLEENLAETEAAEVAGLPEAPVGGGYYGHERVEDAQESDEDEGYYAARQSMPLASCKTASAEEVGPNPEARVVQTSVGSQCHPISGPAQLGATLHPLAQHLQVETSSRSASILGTRPPPPEGEAGPRPQTADAALGGSGAKAQVADEYEQPGSSSYRPASIHSARGAEYFNRLPASGRSEYSESDSGNLYRTGGGGRGGHLPAHTRLYADHFRKQQRLEEERRLRDLEIQLKTEQVHIAPVSNKLASHRTAGAYRNYGERLYVEGRLEAMKKEQLAQRVKEEEARAELVQYSFQPEISKLAQQIKQCEAERGTSSAYQRLYQQAGTAKRQERMQAIRREQDEAEVRECSFRPQINTKSARMLEQRQQILKESGITGYEQLYNDSMRRTMKLQQLAQRPPEDATFRPRVNTSSVVLKKLMEGRQGEVPLGGSIDVAARLLEQGRKYQEKLEAAQRLQEEQPRDSATGQPLFFPKTHRAPQYERNPEGTPIGEYLYSIKAEWDERAARMQHATQRRTQQNAASTFVNSRSERLVDRLKRERFRAVFAYLRRGDPAPVLNLLETVQDELFMSTIDPEVRADIEFAGRLLAKAIARRQRAELQDSATSAPDSAHAAAFAQSTNGELDARGFVALMEDVIARTKGLSRQYLLPMPSARQKFEEPSFRPAIDPHSQALAARMRPESLPAYEVLYKTAEEQAAKREGMQRAAEAAKLKECLFHPVMVAQPKVKEGRAIKLVAELRSKQASEAEGTASAAAGAAKGKLGQQPADASAKAGAGSGSASGASSNGEGDKGDGRLHFDALEWQINEALVRLSLSEEQVVASLQQAEAEREAQLKPVAAVQVVAQSVDANDYRLDFRTICGSPSPDDLVPLPTGCGGTGGPASSLRAFNPLDDADESTAGAGASPVPPADVSVTWADNSRELVAQVIDGGEELAGPACPCLHKSA